MIDAKFLVSGFIIAGLILFYSIDYLQPALPDSVTVDQIVIEKSRHRLSLYQHGQLIRDYTVALGRGGLQDKQRRGDKRVPEGIYYIAGHNRSSTFHTALRVDYPNAQDRQQATRLGYDPGNDIMIHGLRNDLYWIGPFHRLWDWTAGCVAVTNREIDDIARHVPNGTKIVIKP